MILRVPKGCPVIECGGCHTKVNNVEHNVRLHYHLTRFNRRLTGVVQDLLGETIAVQVQMPEGVHAGQEIPVQAGPNGDVVMVVVPEGLTAGETFVTDVAKSKFANAPIVARTDIAPEVEPVAEVAQGYPQWVPAGTTPTVPPAAAAPDATRAVAKDGAAPEKISTAVETAAVPVSLQ